jgi:CheY-like chemotaxis protein
MHMHPNSQPPKQAWSGTKPWSLRTLVVVTPDLDVLDPLEYIDGAGLDTRVLLFPPTQAYAQIKRCLPSLVVICTNFEDLEGCQLLTMLTVDPDTRQIPILIVATPDDPEDQEVDSGRPTPFWLEPLPGLA